MQAVEPAHRTPILSIFVEPARALRTIADAPLRLRSLLVFAAGGVLFGAAVHGVVAGGSVHAGMLYGVPATVHLVIGWAIFAAFFFAIGRALHRQDAWPLAARTSAALNALTVLAVFASSLIAGALALSGSMPPADQGLIPSPATLFAPGSFTAHFAYGFNAISVWFYALVGLALVRVYSMKPRAAALLTLAFVTIVNCCLAAIW